MCVSRLKEVARRTMPFETSDTHQANEMMVLIAAGLVDGTHWRADDVIDDPSACTVRVFAVTHKGEKLLQGIDAGQDINSLLNDLESQAMPFGRRFN